MTFMAKIASLKWQPRPVVIMLALSSVASYISGKTLANSVYFFICQISP